MRAILAALLFTVLPLGAFAQSIVWETEIAGQRRTIEIIDNALHVVPAKTAAAQWRPGKTTALGTVTASDKSGSVVTLAPGNDVRAAIDTALAAGAVEAAPVFIEKARGRKPTARAPRRYLLTHKILVEARDEAAARQAANVAGARSFEPTIAAGRWMLTFANAGDVLDAYAALQAAGIKAQPQFRVPLFKKAAPNDPLYPRQWHLKNTGQPAGTPDVDVNVEPVWDGGNRGEDQVIAIIDDGLQLQHPDLAPNAMPFGGDFQSSFHWNFNATPQNNNPGDLNASGDEADSHGTNCAGVAAARGDNGIGVSGAAPRAKLIGLRLIAGDIVDSDAASAFTWQPNVITVSSNSWGYDDDNSVSTSGPDVLARAALEKAVKEGRNGRGTIFTVAGGNGGTSDYAGYGPGVDESNYDGLANSPFTIAVGGNNDKGVHNFAETGCNLVVTAPTGGEGNDQDITTTTLTGLGDIPGFPDYTGGFNGTSSATPLVSGVIALMLQANSGIGWRDVQEILIRSSRRINDTDASWQTNGAGLPFRFSNRYGAGMVNAQAAVELAKTWSNLPAQTSATRQSGGAIAIPDASEVGATLSFDLSGTNLRIEHVQFTVDVAHPYRGDLEFILRSPSGMQSVVNRRTNDDTTNLQWTFLSVQHWGEQSNGTWTVTVRDRAAQDVGTFNSASLRVYGAAPAVATPTRLGNIATRLRVGTGAEALIGGIIITGNQPKRLIVRAIGPSSGVPGSLTDPQLELNDAAGEVVRANDDWRDAPNSDEIFASTVAPSNDRESAILMTLNPGEYTAVVRGVNGETGVGVVEAYDLDGSVDSKFGNIATRGVVQTDDNVMIGGLIVLGSAPQNVIVRAIGPSLPLEGKLRDTTLDLVDGNGTVLRANNNWRDSQETEIQATTIPPVNDLESAIVATLQPGAYTAIVRGFDGATGIAVVEVYALN